MQTQSRLDLVYEPDQNVFFVTDNLGNIADLEVDFSKEERVCEVVSQLIGDKYIFTEKVSNFPEIYKIIVEKAYECDDDFHRLSRLTNTDLIDQVKEYIISAFNEFMHEKFKQRFGTTVNVEYF